MIGAIYTKEHIKAIAGKDVGKRVRVLPDMKYKIHPRGAIHLQECTKSSGMMKLDRVIRVTPPSGEARFFVVYSCARFSDNGYELYFEIEKPKQEG